MANFVVRLIRIASFVICLIVIASFVIFAVGQTKSASDHQQETISETSKPVAVEHKSTVHKAIDEASDALTSPWAHVVSGSSGEWAIRSARLAIALALYGFGFGYLARVLRVRV
jgi:hypothetical protein